MQSQQNSTDSQQKQAASATGFPFKPGFRPLAGPIKVQRHATQMAIRQLKNPGPAASQPPPAPGPRPAPSKIPALMQFKARPLAKAGAPQPPTAAPAATPRAEAAEQTKACVVTELANYVRRPLADLSAIAARLNVGIGDEAERTAAVAELAAGLRTLGRNLDDVLDFAGYDDTSAAPKFTDIAAISDEVIGMFLASAKSKGVTVSAHIGEMPLLKINGHRLRMIMMALVDNAVKFTASGRIGTAATYRDDTLQLMVEDTGCGMSVQTQQEISEESLSGKWTGSRPKGFAVVGRMVLDMGGEVAIRSTPGIGTVVTVTFTNVSSDTTSTMRRMTSWQRIGTIRVREHKRLSLASKILLADSSPIHNAIAEGMVRSLGFMNTETACSGTDALMRLMSGTVDVIFTDTSLPMMDGRTMIGEIRKIPAFSSLRAYAITADESMMSEYDRIGFDGCILKPITPAKLKAVLG